MNQQFTVSVRREGEVTVLRPSSASRDLDGSIVETARVELLRNIQNVEPPWFVLDLSELEFFASSFLEVLFRVSNRVNRSLDGRFALAALTSHCQEVIEVSRLDQFWHVFDTVQEAIEKLPALDVKPQS